MGPWGGACFNGYPPTSTWRRSGNAVDACVHIMFVLCCGFLMVRCSPCGLLECEISPWFLLLLKFRCVGGENVSLQTHRLLAVHDYEDH